MMSGPKDSIDGPKDHLSMTKCSKDFQILRRISYPSKFNSSPRNISFDVIEG
ncbi:hypothetical protein HanRHA438_Chr14g0650191 [Helianthus annuus]|nr:hypothetical protein HanRHA438_Chr14g0650191 [Helianthus annuus]